MRNGLTPEERLLYIQEQRGLKWRDLTTAQRCERMRQIHQARRDMSPAERQKLKQRLDAEWKALPAAQQQRIEQRIAAREERQAENKGRRGEPKCAGIAPGGAPAH
jgi:hypothetical protein